MCLGYNRVTNSSGNHEKSLSWANGLVLRSMACLIFDLGRGGWDWRRPMRVDKG
jgi:hypothetical protein